MAIIKFLRAKRKLASPFFDLLENTIEKCANVSSFSRCWSKKKEKIKKSNTKLRSYLIHAGI